jgi:hypothetical protein
MLGTDVLLLLLLVPPPPPPQPAKAKAIAADKTLVRNTGFFFI